MGKQGAEFIAAEASDDVGLAEALPQQAGDLLEGVIAFAMAKFVVDVFKIIHIDEDQRRAHALARTQLQVLFRQADETAAIMQTGQLIKEREAAQAQLGLLTGNGERQRSREPRRIEFGFNEKILDTELQDLSGERVIGRPAERNEGY